MMLSLLAMSLIGTGVMPMRTAAGGLVFMLCPGSGAGRIDYLATQMQTLTAPAMGQMAAPQHSGAHSGAHQAMPHAGDPAKPPHDMGDCTWAALHPVLDVPMAALLMMAVDRVHPVPLLPPRFLWVVSAATGLPPATGPPTPI